MMNCNKISERNWELLLEAVDKKRVVPIVGDDFFYVIEDNKKIGIKDFLLRKLSARFNVNDSSLDFSSIAGAIELENFMNHKIHFVNSQTDIYYEIHQILHAQKIYVCDELIKLLQLNQFPLVLTTSFVPGLEEILSQQGCDSIYLSYDKSAISDINSSMINGNQIVVYHLFGRCSKIKKSYNVTEEDLLEYIHLWHDTDARPPLLAKYLSNKFLLVLGCSYPNWLFKFFWHSIRNFTLIPSTNHADKILESMQAVVSMDKAKDDYDLERFLTRIHTSIYPCSSAFIDDFVEQWSKFVPQDQQINESTQDSKGLVNNLQQVDIFISYASEDMLITQRLVEMLRNLGANVWFDKRELVLSEKYETEIASAIGRAKRFMPILSKNTLIQEPRFFRREWAIAHRTVEERFGLPFFAPVLIDDVNPNDERIPKTFRDCHIISFPCDDIETKLKQFIRSIR